MDAEFIFTEPFPEPVVEQEPQALVPQSPQSPPALFITGNNFSITNSFQMPPAVRVPVVD
jgi:hypothetical protein